MAQNKTTILPEDDRTEARHLYQLELEKELAQFVVLGNSDESERIVNDADRLAGDPEDPRRVVWAKNPEFIVDIIESQSISANLEPVDTETPDKAYTVGPSSTIRFVIRHDDPEPNNLKIFEAYIYAERDED
ncbi:MAG: hypothetical protein GVY08_01115 [Bacteroidetes bacterium]|jgi:hypothetical protein|nr:hypothetical protein [Bacteroidota bacterium]